MIEVPFMVDIVPINNQVVIGKFEGFGARFLIPVWTGGLLKWGIEIC